MGSSVGVSKAHDRAELDAAIDRALEFDEWILAEEAVVGREIEVAVLGDAPPEASLPGRGRARRRVLHVRGQVRGRRRRSCCVPAPLDDAQTAEVRALAVRAFAACRCEAMARVDFFFEEPGRGFLVNEVNTIPGFTPISMYPKLWEVVGPAVPGAARPPDRPRDRAPRPPHQARRPPTRLTASRFGVD